MPPADEDPLKSPVKAVAARASRPGESSRLAAASALETKLRDRLATYAPNTQRALRADWTVWHSWCVDTKAHEDRKPRESFPISPPVLVEFIYAHSPVEVRAADGTRRIDESLGHARVKSARTLARYLASLRALHRLAGYKDDPTADADVEAARRLVMRGRTRAKPKQPLRLSQVEEALASPVAHAREARDRAMLAVAYSAMLRRSELVALTVGDIGIDADGSGTATIRHSKRDHAGEGQVRYLAPFAVSALKIWLQEAKIERGPLFRAILPIGALAESALTAHEVARVFKRLAEGLQLDESTVGAIGGHSTRIGAVHDLVIAGFDVASIANAGGWKSLMMPNYYTRELRVKQSATARMTSAHKSSRGNTGMPIKFSVTDSVGNDIAAELNGFARTIGLERAAPGRYSVLLLLALYGGFKSGMQNPAKVIHEIQLMEDPRDGKKTKMKPATPFTRPALRGLMHQHYLADGIGALARNMKNELERSGIPLFDQRIAEATQSGVQTYVTAEDVKVISYQVTHGAMQRRMDRQALTGEWLIYARHQGQHYYLCLGRHDSKDGDLRAQIDAVCCREFPFLQALLTPRT